VRDGRSDDTSAAGQSSSLYRLLARPIQDEAHPPPPPPNTVITEAIETIDNDRALLLLPGAGCP
jgi:hypothetical protein